jgi:hypothetical protein
MARLLTTTNPALYAPGLRKVYFSAVADIPKEFRQFLNVINGANPGGQAGRNYFDDEQVASLSTFVPKPEGDAIQYDRIQQVGSVRYTPFTFGLGCRVTMEAMDDELYGVMAKLSKELGAAGAHQAEVQGHRPFNSGFGTTGGTGFTAAGFDTLALFSTAHTLKRGGTAANRATTDADLSVTAIEIATDLFETTPNESNMPAPRSPAVLIVNPAQVWTAKEIAESQLKPYTANNEINPVKGTFTYFIDHYLTDSDSWYLLAEKDRHDINAWMRKPIDVEFDSDFDTGDLKMKGVFRMAVGHGDWRGTFGSLGA